MPPRKGRKPRIGVPPAPPLVQSQPPAGSPLQTDQEPGVQDRPRMAPPDGANAVDQTLPPNTQTSANPLVSVPMRPEELKKWKADVELSGRTLNRYEVAWERNLKNYTPDYISENWGDEINPGKDFYLVEQKKGQLFYEQPVVLLGPPDGVQMPPPQLQQVRQEQVALNRELGRDKLNILRTVDECLFNVLCPAGIGPVKIGITRITRPAPDGTPVPVYQELFAESFSPKKMRIPSTFRSTNYDKAPWLGMRFFFPLRVGKREFGLPADFRAQARTDDATFKYPGQGEEGDDELISGYEIWYKTAYYDDAVQDPRRYRQLVLVDGLDDPAVHRDSPYQFLDPQGQLTPDSLMGNPIHPLTIRDLADSAYPPSDCMVQRPLVNELARFRTQLTELRDASISVRLVDPAKIPDEALAKVVRAPFGSFVKVPNLDHNQPGILEVPHGQYSRENFEGQRIIEGDIEKLTALSANQTSATEDTVRSATEIQTINNASMTRLQKERNRVIEWYLGLVRKLDALRQHFTPLGDQPSAVMGRYTYDIKPDSGVHVDTAARRQFAVQNYNLLRKDPWVDPGGLLQQLLPEMHLDPAMIAQPPPPHPEPPKISFIIKGDDLNPLMPQYPNVLQALAMAGVPLQNAAQPPAGQPPMPGMSAPRPPLPTPPPMMGHPGAAPKPETIDQHTADRRGVGVPNLGGMAAPPRIQ